MNLSHIFIHCRTSPLSKLGRYAALFYLLTGLALLFAPILIVVDTLSNNNVTITQLIVSFLTSAWALFLSFFLFNMGKKCYQVEKRQIAFGQSGFTIRDRKDKWYLWEEIEDIGVIAYGADASKMHYQTVICIFFNPINQTDLKNCVTAICMV
ncbi:MAG: hypothetical protein IJB17_01845 [Oscillospiraceae bacterium]|nr:hypothetical protein [Oscillospiraceae bacterium]